MHDYIPPLEETSLARNRSGYWEVKWTVPAQHSGKGRAVSRAFSTGVKDHALASKLRREYLATLGHVNNAQAVHTVSSIVDLYLVHHVEQNAASEAQHWALLPVKTLLGTLDVTQLSPQDGARYTRARARGEASPTGKPISPGTIRRELSALRAALRWGVKKLHLPANYVLPSFDLPQEGPARTNVLTDDEERRLHEAAVAVLAGPDMDSLAWKTALWTVLALDTAARAASIEQLTWDRVDFRTLLIDYRDPSRKVTKKRRVPVPISDRLLPVLTAVWARKGQPTRGLVLGTTCDTRHAFPRFAKSVLGRKVSRHDLRRTWATLAVRAGVNLYKVAGVLGDTLAVVEKHYAHLQPDALRNAVNRRV